MTLEQRGTPTPDGVRATVDASRMYRGNHSRKDGPVVVAFYDREMVERRYTGKCKSCKSGVSALVPCVVSRRQEYRYGRTVERVTYSTYVYGDDGPEDWLRMLPCPGCDTQVPVKPVEGKVNPGVACDARCMNATGPNCECACGGANHGAAWG